MAGMIRLRKSLALLLLLVAVFGLSGCSDSWSWHQKLTVTVQTPDGVVSGSSVMRGGMTETRGAFVPAEAIGVSFSLRGEAVVVALPNGRYLFALLKDMPSAGWLFYPKMSAKEAGELLERADASNSRQLELPREHYPLLVTFGDVGDAASVKKVDPNNFAAAFGPGYRLNSITMSVTDEPVTEGGVEMVLGWLSDYPEPKLSPASGRTKNIPFSRRVSHGDFIRR